MKLNKYTNVTRLISMQAKSALSNPRVVTYVIVLINIFMRD